MPGLKASSGIDVLQSGFARAASKVSDPALANRLSNLASEGPSVKVTYDEMKHIIADQPEKIVPVQGKILQKKIGIDKAEDVTSQAMKNQAIGPMQRYPKQYANEMRKSVKEIKSSIKSE